MPGPIELTIDQSRRFAADDRVELEAEGQVDPAPLHVWPPQVRIASGFGNRRFGAGMFGVGRSSGFGRGGFGRGSLGQPITVITLAWQQLHAAADVSLRLRTVDAAGNTGEWGDTFTHTHRPQPSPPASAAPAGFTINITRSNDHV